MIQLVGSAAETQEIQRVRESREIRGLAAHVARFDDRVKIARNVRERFLLVLLRRKERAATQRASFAAGLQEFKRQIAEPDEEHGDRYVFDWMPRRVPFNRFVLNEALTDRVVEPEGQRQSPQNRRAGKIDKKSFHLGVRLIRVSPLEVVPYTAADFALVIRVELIQVVAAHKEFGAQP